MGNLSEILALAQKRAKELGLPYEGALTPGEAHAILQFAPGARLVDVRTRPELDFVGRIPGAIEIEWQFYPGYALNAHFMVELKQQVDRESLVMFICRSGHRSHRAAALATEAGYPDCYNVLEGFEGDKDARGQRGKVGGWRAAGLPWQQG
ncbi:MAG: rhodanese-like domain-containing protein [Betaproteobacteria bacterium]|jgi:rhodanese-related sulfurtransferase|nr:rhodanese-like domain-containing protein [Betaproteobacteria bacterium]